MWWIGTVKSIPLQFAYMWQRTRSTATEQNQHRTQQQQQHWPYSIRTRRAWKGIERKAKRSEKTKWIVKRTGSYTHSSLIIDVIVFKAFSAIYLLARASYVLRNVCAKGVRIHTFHWQKLLNGHI